VRSSHALDLNPAAPAISALARSAAGLSAMRLAAFSFRFACRTARRCSSASRAHGFSGCQAASASLDPGTPLALSSAGHPLQRHGPGAKMPPFPCARLHGAESSTTRTWSDPGSRWSDPGRCCVFMQQATSGAAGKAALSGVHCGCYSLSAPVGAAAAHWQRCACPRTPLGAPAGAITLGRVTPNLADSARASRQRTRT
jgi:hypothetical protein